MKAIDYESNTGFTQKYAFMLSEKTGLPAYLLENAKSELHKGDEIFFLGWVCEGKISGYAKAAKMYSVKGAAAVGIMYPDETTIPQLRENNKVHDIPLFFPAGRGRSRETECHQTQTSEHDRKNLGKSRTEK